MEQKKVNIICVDIQITGKSIAQAFPINGLSGVIEKHMFFS